MNVCLVLAATWICWTVTVRPAACVRSSSLSATGDGHNNNIKKVEFRVTGSTKDSYSAFLVTLRSNLGSGTSLYGIPLLPTPSPQSTSQQDLVLVELFDWGSEPITLVLNRTNAYVIAYQAQNRYYLLSDTPANSLYGNNPHRLTFTGSYTDLQRVAKENRRDIDLGITELAQAITILYYWSPPQVETSVARSLIVLIQMVSESARFRTIEQRVVKTIVEKPPPISYGSFRPGVGVMDLETNWGTLSTAVQQSIDGNFKQAVIIQVSDKKTVEILNVTTTREYVGLALLLRLSTSTGFAANPSIVLDLNIRSMLEIEA